MRRFVLGGFRNIANVSYSGSFSIWAKRRKDWPGVPWRIPDVPDSADPSPSLYDSRERRESETRRQAETYKHWDGTTVSIRVISA